MSFLAYGVIGAALGLALSEWLVRRVRRPLAPNYRGTSLPVVLGAAVTAGVLVTVPLTLAGLTAVGLVDDDRFALAVLVSVSLVFLAGLSDDLRPARTKGLVRQLGALGRGEVTSGVVKLVLIVAAACWFVAIVRPSGGFLRAVLGVAVMAGCANLWNLLDIRPGRSLKYFLPAAAALVAAAWETPFALLGVVAIGGAVAVLPYDLRERAMLGDAGSNVLGLIVGMGLFVTLGAAGLALALVVLLLLHVVAETVTLSRVIETAPPLWWYERLGRVRVLVPGPEEAPEGRDSSPI